MIKYIIFTLLIIFILYMFLRSNSMGRLNPGVGKKIIDAHVHIAGLGYGDSGCFISDKMYKNIRFPFYLLSMGVTEGELMRLGDQILVKKLSAKIEQSETIKQALILAMDAFIDTDGLLNRDKTQLYIPNDYVFKQTNIYDNLLFGASVNPNRKDALQRLREVKEQGAVLIKWIPSIMNINPANPDYIPFYKTMAELNIPLLSHTGKEKSFSSSNDELADPLRLELPLKHGITVIAAHIATTGKSMGEDNFKRILPMIRQYENLYVDISSLTQINKLNYLAKALKEEGVPAKMIYGTDWPLQFFPIVSPWYHINHISIKDAFTIGGIKNQWDRDVALKTAIGVPKSVLLRAEHLLTPDKYQSE